MANDYVSQSVLGLIGELGKSGGLPQLAPHLGTVLAELPLHLRRRAPFIASNAIWAFYEIANAAVATASAPPPTVDVGLGDDAAAAAAAAAAPAAAAAAAAAAAVRQAGVEMVGVVREALPLMTAAVDRLVAGVDVQLVETLEENVGLFRDVAWRIGVL